MQINRNSYGEIYVQSGKFVAFPVDGGYWHLCTGTPENHELYTAWITANKVRDIIKSCQ